MVPKEEEKEMKGTEKKMSLKRHDNEDFRKEETKVNEKVRNGRSPFKEEKIERINEVLDHRSLTYYLFCFHSTRIVNSVTTV